MKRKPLWQDRASRRVRARQLKQHPLCAKCLSIGIRKRATQVDHIVPRHAGGSLTDHTNLRSLCWPCHKQVNLADRQRRTGQGYTPRVRINPDTGKPLAGEKHAWADR